MFLNSLISFSQKLFSNIYNKSFVLKNLDWLIFANILLIIFASGFAQSDSIGYFAIFSIILTGVKLLTKPDEKFILTTADKFLLAYFIIVIISVAGSTLLYFSLKGFFKTFVYLGFYVSLVHYLKDNSNKIKYIFMAIAFTALAESFVAIYQNFLSVSEISGWQDMSRLNPEEVMTRVYGALKPYNPNLFGGYMLAAAPTALVFLGKNLKLSILGLAAFGLSMLSIVLTGCRGAYIGLFFELIVLAFIAYKFLKPHLKRLFLCVSTAVSFFVFLTILSTSSLRARVFSIFAMRNDSSNSFRFNVYNSCLDMFKDNWLLGIGVGNQNFREIYGLYMKTGFDALSAYNIYLETAVESGIFALIAFIGFVVSNIVGAVKYILNERNINVLYISICLVSITGMLFHGFVDTVFFRPQIQFIFWIMMGILRNVRR